MMENPKSPHPVGTAGCPIDAPCRPAFTRPRPDIQIGPMHNHHTMVMNQIDIDKAKAIASNKGIKPGKVKGIDGVQFTKGTNPRLDVITWEDFESILGRRGLAVYEYGGWMKIMKAA